MAYNFPSNPYLNQIYSYNGKTFKWNGVQWVVISALTPNAAPVFVSASPPPNPEEGYLWYNTFDASLYVRVKAPSGQYWESVCPNIPPPAASGLVIVSASPPTNTVIGLLWFNTVDSCTYVRVGSPSGEYWEPVCGNSNTLSNEAQVAVSTSPPLNPPLGLLWFNTVDSSLYVRVQSPQGDYWAMANGSCPQSSKPIVAISSSPPSTPSEGDLWFNPDNSNFSIWYNDIDGGQWVVIPYSGSMVTAEGGAFLGPIYAEYDIPDAPNAFVTADWVTNKIGESSLPKTLLSGKGSLITSTASGVPAELQVGSSGQFLKADPSTSKGLAWSNNVDCGDF